MALMIIIDFVYFYSFLIGIQEFEILQVQWPHKRGVFHRSFARDDWSVAVETNLSPQNIQILRLLRYPMSLPISAVSAQLIRFGDWHIRTLLVWGSRAGHHRNGQCLQTESENHFAGARDIELEIDQNVSESQVAETRVFLGMLLQSGYTQIHREQRRCRHRQREAETFWNDVRHWNDQERTRNQWYDGQCRWQFVVYEVSRNYNLMFALCLVS